MKTINLLITGSLALIIISLALQLPDIKYAASTSQHYSPSVIPIAFIAIALTLFAIIFIRDFLVRDWIKTNGSGQSVADLIRIRRLIFLTASVVYVLCFSKLGFLVSSLTYLTATAFFLGSGHRKELLISFGIAVTVTSTIYVVVTLGLESFLPNFIVTGF